MKTAALLPLVAVAALLADDARANGPQYLQTLESTLSEKDGALTRQQDSVAAQEAELKSVEAEFSKVRAQVQTRQAELR